MADEAKRIKESDVVKHLRWLANQIEQGVVCIGQVSMREDAVETTACGDSGTMWELTGSETLVVEYLRRCDG